ncbi:hypothetical protein ACE0DR_28905 [Azotobacter sp. CWF10]
MQALGRQQWLHDDGERLLAQRRQWRGLAGPASGDALSAVSRCSAQPPAAACCAGADVLQARSSDDPRTWIHGRRTGRRTPVPHATGPMPPRPGRAV